MAANGLIGLCVPVLLCAPPAASQTLGGFTQVDFVRSEESEDQLDDGTGKPLNQDRFVLRRARVRVAHAWPKAEYAAEVDLNTVSGVQLGFRQVEIALRWPARDGDPVPLAEGDDAPSSAEAAPLPALRLGAGVFRAPFGHEVYEQSDAERLFAERSLQAQALFPGEYDLGVRLAAEWEGLHAVLALQNGEPLGARPFPGRDPNAAKDVLARVGVRAGDSSSFRLEAAASVLWGFGYHPGIAATKDTTVWRDLNEDGIAQLGEIQALRGSAATVGESFGRWAVGADLRARRALPGLGELAVFAEAALATNLDRGVRPADPVLLGRDQRGVGASLGVTQELGPWGLIGLRVDTYEPSLDQTDVQGGVLVRSRERFVSYAAAGALRFGLGEAARGRVVLDYTLRQDTLGRDAAGHPADLRNNVLTLRLQLEHG